MAIRAELKKWAILWLICMAVASLAACATSSPPAKVVWTETLPAISRAVLSPTPRPTRLPRSSPVPAEPTSTLLPTPQASDTPVLIPTSVMVYQLCSPIDQISLEILPRLVSDGYHPPPIGSDDRHQGVDFSNYPFLTKYKSFLGVTVQSVLPGYVRASVAGSFPFGNVVIVETPDDVLPGELAASLGIPEGQSLYLLYAHMNEPPSVKLGQEVTACQAVGSVGASGNTYAPHLHLETRYGPPGVDFDGFSAFVDGVTEKERANYKLWRTSGMFQHFNPLRLLAPDAIPTPTALPD